MLPQLADIYRHDIHLHAIIRQTSKKQKDVSINFIPEIQTCQGCWLSPRCVLHQQQVCAWLHRCEPPPPLEKLNERCRQPGLLAPWCLQYSNQQGPEGRNFAHSACSIVDGISCVCSMESFEQTGHSNARFMTLRPHTLLCMCGSSTYFYILPGTRCEVVILPEAAKQS